MNRYINRPILLILATLMLLLSISATTTENIRGKTVASMAPVWERLNKLKTFLKSPLSYFNGETYASEKGRLSASEEMQRLRLENRLLGEELTRLNDLVQSEITFNALLESFYQKVPPDQLTSQLLKRHQEQFKESFNLQLQALPGRVIFRSPTSWNNSLWINIGEIDNSQLSTKVICKNSPVVIGTSIVGVVDYVGAKQSRVRLITDSGLTPSVRATRQGTQHRLLVEHLDFVLGALKLNSDALPKGSDTYISDLESLNALFNAHKESHYLAKGELRGSTHPIWRTQGRVLKGTGFNYDFADEEGESRDLRTGKVLNGQKNSKPIQLLKVHDLLVTTGMDGIFPAGLNVGEVTKVYPLKEGDYYYDIEARPTAGNLDELSLVFVIPPIGYDKSDQPPLIGR